MEYGVVVQSVLIPEQGAQRKVELQRTNNGHQWHHFHGVSGGVNLLHHEFLTAHLNVSVIIRNAVEVELVAAAVIGSVLPPERIVYVVQSSAIVWHKATLGVIDGRLLKGWWQSG